MPTIFVCGRERTIMENYLSAAVFDIGFKSINWGRDLDRSGSPDVVVHVVTIRFYTGHFLFASSSESFSVRIAVQPHNEANTLQTTDRQTQHYSISATIDTVG